MAGGGAKQIQMATSTVGENGISVQEIDISRYSAKVITLKNYIFTLYC